MREGILFRLKKTSGSSFSKTEGGLSGPRGQGALPTGWDTTGLGESVRAARGVSGDLDGPATGGGAGAPPAETHTFTSLPLSSPAPECMGGPSFWGSAPSMPDVKERKAWEEVGHSIESGGGHWEP